MPPKRKSDATAEVANKKTRLDADHTVAAGLVDIILADPKNFEIPDDDDELRDNMLALAKYARHLRDVACSTPAAPPAQPAAASNAAAKKSPEDLTAAAERLRKAAASGVKKQMVVSTHPCLHNRSATYARTLWQWRPACKNNSAKWVYDGVCPDPEVFGAMLGLGGPPKFKQKKMTSQEFQDQVGWIQGHAR